MGLDFGTMAVLFPLLLLLAGLGFTAVIDPYIRREHRSVMLIIVLLSFSLVMQNILENEFFISRSNLAWKNLLSAYGYSVRPVILILFLQIIRPNGKRWLYWTLAGVNAALYFSSPLTRLCFKIRETDYVFMRGPLWSVCLIFSTALLAELLTRTILLYRKTGKHERLIPIGIVLSILASIALDLNVGVESQPISFLTIAIVVSSIFYYIWLHLQFVREHENDLMASQRIQIMMTQIQPHFLFNALNTIRALYAKDPPLADKTLEDFSTYLRQNLESLSQTELIPLSKEMEHTRLYAEIEMLRFPHVQMEYRIEDDRFEIPALTIQPLVENAICHGVRTKKDGLVSVATVREGNVHRITIRDNGAGFDPDQKTDEKETHIGLQNVKNRIEQMCGGKMLLKSEIGRGTSVTLLIPDAGNGEKRKTQK